MESQINYARIRRFYMKKTTKGRKEKNSILRRGTQKAEVDLFKILNIKPSCYVASVSSVDDVLQVPRATLSYHCTIINLRLPILYTDLYLTPQIMSEYSSAGSSDKLSPPASARLPPPHSSLRSNTASCRYRDATRDVIFNTPDINFHYLFVSM